MLGLLLVVFESTATLLRPRQLAWSPNSSATLAAAVLLGPVGAGLVGACTVFGMRRGPSVAQRAFNTGMMALSAYLAGSVFVAVGGQVGIPHATPFRTIIGPFAVAAVVHAVTNHTLLAGVLWLTSDRDFAGRRAPLGMSVKLIASDLGYGAFGLLIAALWSVTGLFAPVLILIPLFVARWAVAQLAEQQQAYEATVGALCQAVETKDFYTRGHSDRVSRGSVMIAREIGMRGERVEAIRYAGMLHDVGKLGVPTKVLQKTGKLTEEEYAAIQLHPMRGLDIVREIGFLDEALAGIMHHHERIDGRGYPMGLALRRDPRVRPGAGRGRRVRLHDLHPVLPRRAPGRGGGRGAQEVVGHAVRPGVRGCVRGRDQARRLAEPRAARARDRGADYRRRPGPRRPRSAAPGDRQPLRPHDRTTT